MCSFFSLHGWSVRLVNRARRLNCLTRSPLGSDGLFASPSLMVSAWVRSLTLKLSSRSSSRCTYLIQWNDLKNWNWRYPYLTTRLTRYPSDWRWPTRNSLNYWVIPIRSCCAFQPKTVLCTTTSFTRSTSGRTTCRHRRRSMTITPVNADRKFFLVLGNRISAAKNSRYESIFDDPLLLSYVFYTNISVV